MFPVCCSLQLELSDEALYPQSRGHKSLSSSVELILVLLGSKIVPVLKVITSVKVELLCLFILKHAVIVGVILPTF